MTTFREFQFATIVFVIAIPTQIFLAIIFALQTGSDAMPVGSFVVSNGVFLIVYLLFYRMKTTVGDEYIRISYGIGLIRKSIKLSDIKTVSTVTNPWYYGWGIRFIPNGMLYNISGSKGVELTFKDTSRVIRIGSANVSSLQQGISSQLKV